MKKKMLLTILLLMMPFVVYAKVDNNTEVGQHSTQVECMQDVAQNDAEANKNATTGYYLTCIKVSCVNSKVAHDDLAPLSANITCQNKNTEPWRVITQSAITAGVGLDESSDCSTNSEDEDYLEESYFTVLYQFNCVRTISGATYNLQPDVTTTTTGGAANVDSPPTGVDTYYFVLSMIVVLLSIGLYIVNKKSLFKKI